MREAQEPAPLVARERALAVGNRRIPGNRPIARHHADLQELARRRIGGELKVAILVSLAHPRIEELGEVVDTGNRDAPLYLAAAGKPQA